MKLRKMLIQFKIGIKYIFIFKPDIDKVKRLHEGGYISDFTYKIIIKYKQ